MFFRTIIKGALSFAILAMSVLGACRLMAECENKGVVAQGCSQGQGADSGCAGSDRTQCEADTAQESEAGDFGCSEVEGRKNCRDGVTKDFCYTRWHCVYLDGCHVDPNSKDEFRWWVKTSDACPPSN